MESIRFSIFKKKTEGLFGHFYNDSFDIFKIYEGRRVLTFLKFMKVEEEGIGVKESVLSIFC